MSTLNVFFSTLQAKMLKLIPLSYSFVLDKVINHRLLKGHSLEVCSSFCPPDPIKPVLGLTPQGPIPHNAGQSRT